MLVQPGDFAAVKMKGDTGTLIHIGEILNGDGFRDYEHAFVYVGGSQDMILEAEPGGAVIRVFHYPLNDVLWSTDNVGLSLTIPQRRVIPQIAEKYKGTPYSALDYFALAARRLHIPAPQLRGYIADTGHMICSQLADQVRLDVGSHLFSDGRWPGDVTPADLANLILS